MQDISTEARKNWLLLFTQTIPSWEGGGGKRVFILSSYIKKKKNLFFVLPSVKMRLIKKI